MTKYSEENLLQTVSFNANPTWIYIPNTELSRPWGGACMGSLGMTQLHPTAYNLVAVWFIRNSSTFLVS
jgi:hypothetical protein